MHAIEFEADIRNHRVEVSSAALPENAGKAKVIVLFDLPQERKNDLEEVLDRAFGCLGRGKSPAEIDAEMRILRSEWDRDWDK